LTQNDDHEPPLVEESKKPKNRWAALALELVVIFVGITASFWVDEWREKRQDTETFNRILSQIYYDVHVDEAVLIAQAASNNEALLYTGDLVLRDKELPPADELFRQLEIVFSDVQPSPSLGGYSRLVNTPLAIPVNDVQLSLDEGFGLYLNNYNALVRKVEELRDVRASYWSNTGIVSCPIGVQEMPIDPRVAGALDLEAQFAPARAAVQDQEECLPDPSNQQIALRAMRDPEFRLGLRRVMQIRENMAMWLARLRTRVESLRAQLETSLPDITLPVETLGLVGSATPVGWDVANALPMRRVGTHDWMLEVRLEDGEVKFAANGSYTMDWGAPRPWVARGSYMGFEEGLIAVDEFVSSGTARFKGVNIPVKAGHYQVRFNTQSGEYSFEHLTE